MVTEFADQQGDNITYKVDIEKLARMLGKVDNTIISGKPGTETPVDPKP